MRDNYCRQGYHHPSHDIFTVEVLVRMSDLPETANNTNWNVRLGVSTGEVISVANREVTVARVSSDGDRKISERPVININLQLEDVSQSDTERIGKSHLYTAGHQGLQAG